MVRDLLSEKSIKERGFFKPKIIREIIKENISGQIDASYLILSMLAIEIWFSNFFDNRIKNIR